MKIYIIFGDVARCDGENIKGIYTDEEKAIEALNEMMTLESPYYELEVHEICG